MIFLFPGFLHEHNRPDRSSYVTVITENILDSRLSDFKKRDGANSEWFEPGDVDTQNTPFDFQSVLLYPPALSGSKSISKNGEKTLKYNAPLIESWPNFPPEEEPLTVIDTVELALAYNCLARKLSCNTSITTGWAAPRRLVYWKVRWNFWNKQWMTRKYAAPRKWKNYLTGYERDGNENEESWTNYK